MDVVFAYRRRPWLAVLLAMTACSENEAPPDDDPRDGFDRVGLLRNIGENVVIPTYEAFAQNSRSMVTAVEAYCEALGTADEQTRRVAAREAWQEAMDVWQRAEMLLFGPAAADNQTLRSRIYSWPVVSTCVVDQDVMLFHDDPGSYDIGNRLDNRRGLDALEHVLFAADLAHTCPPQTAPTGWDALSEAEKKAARCGYAGVAAGDVAAQAGVLLDAWLPDGGDHLGALVAAGEAGSPFASEHEAINEITDALFYLDIATKDLKLAVPVGIVPNRCGSAGTPCPEDVELPTSRRSLEAIRENLVAFRMVLLGNGPVGEPGPGFDDYLRHVGADSLRARMEENTSAALAAVDAVPGTLHEALSQDRASVVDLHDAVKAITDDLKGEFVTILKLMIPEEGAGDSD